MEWTRTTDRLPDENGKYLAVYDCFQCKLIKVLYFANDLYFVDEYAFRGEHRPGWYDSDSEFGYFERIDVTHWMPLPELPCD